MKREQIIKRIEEDKTVTYYRNVRQAASDIETTMDNWKVEMLIATVLNKGKKAFKCIWQTIDKI